jgi:hypothetical protein
MITDDKKSEFSRLFNEFITAYPTTPDGQRHLEFYEIARQEGRENFAKVVAAADQGENITDLVLLRLLPYQDSAANRKKGAWVHIAPSITGDIKGWFENVGWTQPEDWPRIAKAILSFAGRCKADPQELPAACREFSELPYTKGLQTGMLTPILNALRPNEFVIVNNKSRRVINYFAGTSYGQKLVDYPATNATAVQLITELWSDLQSSALSGLRDADQFDMFCHWLVAVKQYHFGDIRYWKIAPGAEAWNWEACREGDFIAVGWDEMGDVFALRRAEFEARRNELVAKYDDWNEGGVEELWKFAHKIKEGDRIVANRGTKQVLGVGTVVGPYEFVPGIRHGHRRPVEWDDLTVRQVDEYGWRRALIELDREKFELVRNAPAIKAQLAEPFSRIFSDRAEAEWAFEFVRETFRRLGVMDASDTRFALTLRNDNRILRLNFGNWAVLQFYGPGYAPYRMGVALFTDRVAFSGPHRAWGPFAGSKPEVRVYELPIEQVRPLDGALRTVYEDTFAYIAERFRRWMAGPYRKYNQPEIAAAIFDPSKCDQLLSQGSSIDNPAINEEYPLARIAEETSLDETFLARWVQAIERKKQAIIYGPPGTGKTYLAKQLARHLIGGGDGFDEVVQFHPAYAYEDFIQGIRPDARPDGGIHFSMIPGRFLEFCEKASACDDSCVLIVDEINRANLARVFGELMYLMEYREDEVPLAGGGTFRIPANVRIIGTMNTADRSIALVDHALRRRFAFLALYPNYEILRRYHETTGFPVDGLIQVLRQLNTQIADRHYEVGVSFFLRKDLKTQIEDIWQMEIEPYLEEYFFDQPEKASAFGWDKIRQQVLK